MPTIELINLTQWHDALVQGIVARLCQELRLRKQVRFLFQDIWTAIDEETGEIVAGTESPETTWDGDACQMSNGG
jgi:hypothetical protein